MGDRAERARHVGLEDDPQLLGLAGLDLAVEVLEGRAATPLAALGGGRGLAAPRPSRGLPCRRGRRAGCRRPRARRPGRGRRPRVAGPALVTRLPLSFSSARTRPNVSPTTMMSPTLSVPVWTSAVATGPRPLSSSASTIVPTAARFGLALSSWRSATSRIISIRSSRPDPGLGRDRDERHVAAVLLDDDAGLGQLGLDAVRVGVRLVDLVEGDDDRHLGRLGVADRLERLGHHAVVGGDHDHRDVGHPGAAGAHGGERLVTRRVEEDDALAVLGDLARADVLGDPAALAGGDLGRPDGVEQARLAVVDVAHDGHDRGARLEQRRIVLLEEDLLGRLGDLAVASRRRRRWCRPPGRPRPPRSRARPATSDAVSRSTSWLIVAKIPLLISSRMMSAGLTPSSSASSLTVIVPGSSIAPRSRGSSDLHAAGGERRRRDAAACADRAGRACRSYSWPRAPPSASVMYAVAAPGERRSRRSAGSGVRSARLRAPLVMALSRQASARHT